MVDEAMKTHSSPSEDHVLLFLPLAAERLAVEAALTRAGLACRNCGEEQELCRLLDSAGAAVVSQEALTAPVMTRLVQTLDGKPERAEYPFVLLFGCPGETSEAIRLLDLLEAFGNLTVLERPIRPLALISAVRTAVRVRHTLGRVRQLGQRLKQELLDRDQRLARLVHKLRTPLNTILTAAEVLDRIGEPTATAANQLALIRRQTLQLARLVSEIQETPEPPTQPGSAAGGADSGGGPEQESQQQPRAPRRLLLVEDDVEGREALCFLLRLHGIEVDVAADGPQGLQMALEHRPDVVLLDLDLPGLTGYEVCAGLREQLGGEVRLVALTGLGQESALRQAREAGFDDCLVKPVPMQELSRALRVCGKGSEPDAGA